LCFVLPTQPLPDDTGVDNIDEINGLSYSAGDAAVVNRGRGAVREVRDLTGFAVVGAPPAVGGSNHHQWINVIVSSDKLYTEDINVTEDQLT